jgi:hypothetical protein
MLAMIETYADMLKQARRQNVQAVRRAHLDLLFAVLKPAADPAPVVDFYLAMVEDPDSWISGIDGDYDAVVGRPPNALHYDTRANLMQIGRDFGNSGYSEQAVETGQWVVKLLIAPNVFAPAYDAGMGEWLAVQTGQRQLQ